MILNIVDESGKAIGTPFQAERVPNVGEIIEIGGQNLEVVRIHSHMPEKTHRDVPVSLQTIVTTKRIGATEGAKAAHGRRELREG